MLHGRGVPQGDSRWEFSVPCAKIESPISEADIIPNRAAGYELVQGEIKNQKWVSPSLNTTADGALYTNVLDMAKWDAALYTETLLNKSSLAQIWTPVTLNNGKRYPYGFGWDVTQQNGHRLLEHDGAWQGFTTHISRYLDDRLTVVVLINLDSDNADADKIANGVASLYIPALKKRSRRAYASSTFAPEHALMQRAARGRLCHHHGCDCLAVRHRFRRGHCASGAPRSMKIASCS